MGKKKQLPSKKFPPDNPVTIEVFKAQGFSGPLPPPHLLAKYNEAFEGWIQERGLYFMRQWDSRYTPLLSGNDPGEEPKNGGMLFARYGKGFYIYTAYAWFRQLPAGVPGAFRIFANMLSLGR